MYKGQQVIRVAGPNGCFPSVGSRGHVKDVLDDDTFTLEGCGEEVFCQVHFRPHNQAEPVHPVHSLMEALEVIDKWNKVCPTGQLISIEGHPAVDGGSVFMIGNHYDSNNPQDLLVPLMGEATRENLKAQLESLNKLAESL